MPAVKKRFYLWNLFTVAESLLLALALQLLSFSHLCPTLQHSLPETIMEVENSLFVEENRLPDSGPCNPLPSWSEGEVTHVLPGRLKFPQNPPKQTTSCSSAQSLLDFQVF